MDSRIEILAKNIVNYSCSVKKGDNVLYAKYSGTEITLDDKKYVVVRQSDILAVIE